MLISLKKSRDSQEVFPNRLVVDFFDIHMCSIIVIGRRLSTAGHWDPRDGLGRELPIDIADLYFKFTLYILHNGSTG